MEISDKSFNSEIINSEIPVLIEFWASWCVPCQMIEYILKDLEKEYNGKIKIAKLNVDRNRIIPKTYNITGVPTFMTFLNGEIDETRIGAQSKKDLIKMIERVLIR